MVSSSSRPSSTALAQLVSSIERQSIICCLGRLVGKILSCFMIVAKKTGPYPQYHLAAILFRRIGKKQSNDQSLCALKQLLKPENMASCIQVDKIQSANCCRLVVNCLALGTSVKVPYGDITYSETKASSEGSKRNAHASMYD